MCSILVSPFFLFLKQAKHTSPLAPWNLRSHYLGCSFLKCTQLPQVSAQMAASQREFSHPLSSKEAPPSPLIYPHVPFPYVIVLFCKYHVFICLLLFFQCHQNIHGSTDLCLMLFFFLMSGISRCSINICEMN